jgi:hypothetical protein
MRLDSEAVLLCETLLGSRVILEAKGYRLSSPSSPWNLNTQGMDQLDQLNAMERQQDVNQWTSGSILGAIYSILLVAALGKDTPPWYMFTEAILGFVVSLGWLLTALRARVYEVDWVKKAKTREVALGIPEEYRAWGRARHPGIPSWVALVFVVLAFLVVWIAVLAYVALGLGIRWPF